MPIKRFFAAHKEWLIPLLGLALYCALAFLLHIPCPIKWITGISCPGCGMTRSLLSVCKLDLSAAVSYHPLIFYLIVAAPLYLLFLWRDMKRARKVLTVITVALMLAVYLYRMIWCPSPVTVFAPENGAFARFVRWLMTLFR